ncbi:MAG: ubiquitin-conjugating enzyme E2-binding protein [Linnemannia gamsii]|nr:MAG: ubiquitin-conjugating enzyme E2-binding protein [Linnemannia gamsii]
MSMDKARYHAEYHSKINSITLSVQVPQSGVTCRIGPQAVDLIPAIQPGLDFDAIQQQGTIDKLVLPARVMPTRTTLDPSTSHSNLLSLKMTALPNMPLETSLSTLSLASSSEFPSSPLPASQLQGLENLACGSCGNVLLNSTSNSTTTTTSTQGPIQRVVDLPSEHWQELVDCWMCHEEDFTELREGDLGARLGQALVGGTYLLIHAKDVDHEAVMIEEDARSVDWKRTTTSFTAIGQKESRGVGVRLHVRDACLQSAKADLEMIQVKFHKYLVRYHGKHEQKSLTIPRQRFPSYVATEIFESARHHATYRFIIQDRLQGRDMLLLWMLNWDTTVVTNQEPLQDNQLSWDDSLRMDLNTTSSGRGKKVMKVVYLCAVPEDQDQKQQQNGVYSKELKVWDQWRGDPGVERLEFQERLVLGLIGMLEQSSSCTPPGLNGAASAVMAMDGMRVGSFEI